MCNVDITSVSVDPQKNKAIKHLGGVQRRLWFGLPAGLARPEPSELGGLPILISIYPQINTSLHHRWCCSAPVKAG